MRTTNLFIFILFLFLALPFTSSATEDNPWKRQRVCTFGMPYIGHAVSQRETGILTSILKAVFEPEKINLRHVALPYKRALNDLAEGKIQCTLDIKDNRKGFLQAKSTMAFYDLSAAYMPKETKWEGIQSLKDQKVAYLHGFDIENLIPITIRPQMVYDLSSAYHMLDRGHITFILDDNMLLKDAMYDSKLPSHEFTITKVKSFEVRPIFSNTEEGRQYRNIFDRRMQEMIADGELATIMRENGLSEDAVKRVLQAN